jgi:hypothetical protein
MGGHDERRARDTNGHPQLCGRAVFGGGSELYGCPPSIRLCGELVTPQVEPNACPLRCCLGLTSIAYLVAGVRESDPCAGVVEMHGQGASLCHSTFLLCGAGETPPPGICHLYALIQHPELPLRWPGLGPVKS